VKRTDAADRGFSYILELNINLVSGVWTHDGYTVVNSNTVDSACQFITNRVPMAEGDEQFIRLQEEYQLAKLNKNIGCLKYRTYI
jgi:hypothetical protein